MMTTSDNSLTLFISEYVKVDRKLLRHSVIELTKHLRKILLEKEYEIILSEQKNPQFWIKENLFKFYDFSLQVWNEKRISKMN